MKKILLMFVSILLLCSCSKTEVFINYDLTDSTSVVKPIDTIVNVDKVGSVYNLDLAEPCHYNLVGSWRKYQTYVLSYKTNEKYKSYQDTMNIIVIKPEYKIEDWWLRSSPNWKNYGTYDIVPDGKYFKYDYESKFDGDFFQIRPLKNGELAIVQVCKSINYNLVHFYKKVNK